MHGPHSVLDFGLCTAIQRLYTVEVCRRMTNEKQRKTDIDFTDQ